MSGESLVAITRREASGSSSVRGEGASASSSAVPQPSSNASRRRRSKRTAGLSVAPRALTGPTGGMRRRGARQWLIPFGAVVLYVVAERVVGGWYGRAAGIVARVRGPVPRRRGLRPLAAREALAGRVPLPGLRPRQGLGAGPRAADPAVRGVRTAGLGHRRHGAARQPPRPAHLVPGRLADGHPRQRHLGPAAVEAARARLLQVGLALGPQAAPGD